MGLFSRIFGKRSGESKVVYASQDELMEEAYRNAQENFKYFWRELSWEYHRIVPALDFAMVKHPFQQIIDGQQEPVVEHMWIDQVMFDGETIKGELVNDPNQLTNVKQGDSVSITISEISDWMISLQGQTLGGFTIQAMRKGMSSKERRQHDEAWGLDFGDPDEVLVVQQQKEHPEYLIEHPMSRNMADQLREFLQQHPGEIAELDQDGLTQLHKEAIAGNKVGVEVLLELGADKNALSNTGKTAGQYAENMNWDHLKEVLK